MKMDKTVQEIAPLSANAVTVLERRYLKRDKQGKATETPADMFRRVAAAIAAAEKVFDREDAVPALEEDFYKLMTSLEFLPNSPTLMNAGRELGQLSACFVLPVGDSMESIFEAIKNTALIHKSGGGTGFSFSRVRPANDEVRSTSGVSSGPLSFMKVFDAATETIKQGGTRRGANMGILRVDHPDIIDFIMAKRDQKVLTNFNLSVGLTEAFMAAVEAGGEYDIINPRTGTPARKMSARKVFEHIVEMAWTNGEPGIVFLDRLNRDNPTPQVGEFEATNPCGEQPLLPFESCNLGSINVAKMVTADGKVDWDRLRAVVRLAARFLDNVIEVNNYPLADIDRMTRANRKIGLGVMGWADLLIQLGIPYGDPQAVALGEKLMQFVTDEARATSRELAAERGPFPNFKGSVFDKEGAEPVRNATSTTIAPTGTISIIANASSGIEPLFAVSYVRQVLDNDVLVEVHPLFEKIARERGFYSTELMKKIAEHGTVQDLPEIPADVRRAFVTAHDITPEDHIRMQAAFQKYTDNAVSKTVNFPHEASREDVASVYRMAWQQGCKGVTIYRDGSRDMQVLSVKKEQVKPEDTVPVESRKAGHKRDRPLALRGSTYQMETGCGPLYVTVNEDDQGVFELFTTMGKAGGCAASQCEAIGRLVSLAWRSGVQARQSVKQMIGITCHKPAGFGDNRITSCADAVAKAIQMHMSAQHGANPTKHSQNGGACPECGGPVEHEGGCCVCHACGYSECA
ncbi:MAG: vitamin B12-dependent ribonucleotide reductase [Desulfuromonadales bacterium]